MKPTGHNLQQQSLPKNANFYQNFLNSARHEKLAIFGIKMRPRCNFSRESIDYVEMQATKVQVKVN